MLGKIVAEIKFDCVYVEKVYILGLGKIQALCEIYSVEKYISSYKILKKWLPKLVEKGQAKKVLSQEK